MKTGLWLRHDQAGDALKTLPVWRAFRKVYGNDFDISILCSRANYSIFENEPGIRAVLEPTGNFDFVISLLVDAKPTTAQLFRSITAAQKIENSLSRVTGVSESALIAQILESGLALSPLLWQSESAVPVFSEEEIRETERRSKEKTRFELALCPFASVPERTLAPPEIQKLWETALERGASKVWLVGSSKELALLDGITLPNRVERFSAKHFRHLGVLLQTVDGVVGADSGPMHFAKILGTPLLVFGRGVDIDRWYSPLDSKDQILRKGLLSSLPASWEQTRALKKWISKHFQV